jgi:putative transcriptional regulator
MPVVYKFDVIAALKSAGYSTYKIRKEKLLSESTMQKFRNHEPVSWENISTLCQLLNCQPGDIMEYVEDDE